jgi:hypothetical protein
MADVQLPLCEGLIFSSLEHKITRCLGRTFLILVFALGANFCSSGVNENETAINCACVPYTSCNGTRGQERRLFDICACLVVPNLCMW